MTSLGIFCRLMVFERGVLTGKVIQQVSFIHLCITYDNITYSVHFSRVADPELPLSNRQKLSPTLNGRVHLVQFDSISIFVTGYRCTRKSSAEGVHR